MYCTVGAAAARGTCERPNTIAAVVGEVVHARVVTPIEAAERLALPIIVIGAEDTSGIAGSIFRRRWTISLVKSAKSSSIVSQPGGALPTTGFPRRCGNLALSQPRPTVVLRLPTLSPLA